MHIKGNTPFDYVINIQNAKSKQEIFVLLSMFENFGIYGSRRKLSFDRI